MADAAAGLRGVAIAGVHVTAHARFLGRTRIDVAVEAVLGALADAGLTPADVDGCAVEWPGPGGKLGEAMSWGPFFGGLTWAGEGLFDCAGVRGIAKAAAAISAGLCEVAVVGGGTMNLDALKQDPKAAAGSKMGLEFNDAWGAYSTVHFALVAQRHMHEFGTTPAQLATVASVIRNNGAENPDAVMFRAGPYTVQDVLDSRMVATPLHLLDLCLIAEGGAAVVLTSLERARDLRHPPIVMPGVGMELHSVPYATPALYREVGRIGVRSAKRALTMAGVSIEEVDLFSLYDPNSFEIIRQFEALGLCGEGEGGPFAEEQSFAYGGAHPTNVEGGCLSCAWNGTQQMTIKVIEAVRQLRGTCAFHQVDGVEVALASNVGAGSQHYEVGVLTRA